MKATNKINISSTCNLLHDTVKVQVLCPNFAHNPTFQELPKMNEYFATGDKKMFIDLKRGKGYSGGLENKRRDDSDLTVTTILKPDSTKKMKLRVTGYYQGEYLWMLSQGIWCKQAK